MRESIRNSIFFSLALVLVAGCTSKEEEKFLNIYENNKDYHLKLGKTEKTQLLDANYTKALLTATYLFEQMEDVDDIRDEKFIVGLYKDDENGSFENTDYNLTLKGRFKNGFKENGDIKYATKKKLPKRVEKLNSNDVRLKNISFSSDWTEYYLFTFPHTESKSFKLIFQSKNYGKGKLNFAKVSKFVLTKEAF